MRRVRHPHPAPACRSAGRWSLRRGRPRRWVSHTWRRPSVPRAAWKLRRTTAPSRGTSSSGISSGSSGSPSSTASAGERAATARDVEHSGAGEADLGAVGVGSHRQQRDPVRRHGARQAVLRRRLRGAASARRRRCRWRRRRRRPPAERAGEAPLDGPCDVGLLVAQEQHLLDRRTLERGGHGAGEQEGVGHRRPRRALVERHRQLEHAPPPVDGRTSPFGRSSVSTPNVSTTTSERVVTRLPVGRSRPITYQSLPYPLTVSIISSCGRSVPPGCSAPRSSRRVLHLPEPRRRHAAQRHRRRHRRPHHHRAGVGLGRRRCRR